MIKTIIVEDDPNHQKELVSQLKKATEEFNILAIAETVNDAYDAVLRFKPDLVFLDIELGFGGNGFDLLRKFKKPSFAVIFISSHNTFDNAKLAMHACALDFLTKPVKYPELEHAINEFIKRGSTILEQIQSFGENISSENGEIKEIWESPLQGQGRVKIEVSNVFYCESKNGCTCFYLINPIGKFNKIISTKGIGEWETILEASKIRRPHNQYLANLSFVQGYVSDTNTATLIMVNPVIGSAFPTEIPVSRNKKADIRKALGL